MRKEYLKPITDIIELNYRENVCNTMSGEGIGDYDPMDPPVFDAPLEIIDFPSLF